jgi:hypothetical protein
LLLGNLVPFHFHFRHLENDLQFFIMKKLMTYIFCVTLFIAAGCKKDVKTKIYLLRQQIIDYRPANHQVDTISYTYDDHNRITMITEPTGQSKGNFSITYREDGRVNVARKLSDSGAVVVEYDFFYTPNSQGYYFKSPTHSLDTSVFTFNDKNQITRIQSRRAGYLAYTYDSRGNVATSVIVGADNSVKFFDNVTYAYDTQKNPFSQIPSGNYFFMYISDNDPSTLINNIQFKNGDTYTYTYNSDGYPVKGTINIGSALIPIYFNYIVK